MVTSLARSQFADRHLETDDLQTLTRMLADWKFQREGGDRLILRLSLNLWGFPRADAEEVRARLAEAAPDAPEDKGVTLSEPDVITVTAPERTLWRDGAALQNLPDAAEFLRPLLDPAQEGICAELRIALGGVRVVGGAEDDALVLWGVRERGQFRIRAVWPQGKGNFSNNLYAFAAWPHETALFAALHDYRNGNRALPLWARDHLFLTDAGRRANSGLVWFLVPERGDIGAYLTRLAVSGGIAAVSFALLAVFLARPVTAFTAFPVSLFTALCAMGVVGFGYHSGMKLFLIHTAWTRMRENFKAVYAQPIAPVETDLGAIPGALQDPALIKLSQDIENLGGRHFKDIRLEPETPVVGNFYIRLYVFPDDATVFTLMLMHHVGKNRIFPARVTFLLRTNLTDGWRLVSTNGGIGYRKPLRLPVIGRVAEGLTDPQIMVQKHRAALQEATAAGKRPLPLVPEEILADITRDQQQTREAVARYGYFHWGDAARMVFKMPRPENRF